MVPNPLVTAVSWQFIVCCSGGISREQTPWHPSPAGPGLQGPDGAMLRTHTRAFPEPHQAPAAADTQGRGKGKNKNRKDGRKGKTKTQRETILWKSMKWDSKTSV